MTRSPLQLLGILAALALVATVTMGQQSQCTPIPLEPQACMGNDGCAPDQFCDFVACDDRSGVCEDRPAICPDVWDPVCGCDGRTYGNSCEAHAAGVSVAHAGECPPPPCWDNTMCPADEFCYFAECALETGACQPRPEICPDVWDPVCGCDGQTYANACEAAHAGVSVDFEGECPPPPCTDNSTCAPSQYCLLPACDAPAGDCVERPLGCPDIWDPVCGCDGQTYANECDAAMAGFSVDYAGECLPSYCWDNTMCAVAEYCYFADCALETGECLPRPEICPDVWAPVCGCDNQTYGNACEAAHAGVSVDYEGECLQAYCWDNTMCAVAEYCYFADCALETGECLPRPEICPDIWAPVCGCDDQTYGNACEAAHAGVSVDYEGECLQAYCWDNTMCAEAEYCYFADCALETGECQPRPEICPDIWAPVCGCDLYTYANACEAAAAGMSVLHEGECLVD